ncbi:phosphate ABC transporter permease subunit PstC [Oceanomicrobium pacificus]|uniref:Phosphate transport system permease protein n=1 Tax=Oceanomicrobium pacificus TaxID=2692916 RepID=A0A6B0TW11_9RHOB|nr:phosphate ABC transporter permease subunit PstC [Oceanomicrobium pacificus]MXU66869.1 phosphate ABC transporter permease subunit PstC [Oceanomicrobium pacificus]
MASVTALVLIGLGILFFLLGRNRALQMADGRLQSLHSRPGYHGLYLTLGSVLTGLVVLVALQVAWPAVIENQLLSRIAEAQPDLAQIEQNLILSDAVSIAEGNVASTVDPLREEIAASFAAKDTLRQWTTLVLSVLAALAVGFYDFTRISPQFRARNRAEAILRTILMICAVIAILTTVGIVLSLIFETLGFFAKIDWRIDKFLFGTRWSPLSGVHSGEMDPDKVGAVPLFTGTFLITLIAMLVAVPIGLFAAIYLSDFASPKVRSWAKPMLEILAGVPTVVYGFFAAITVAPFIRGTGEALGLSVASESALAAGVVMGIMIIPFVSSLSDDVINAVPQSLRDGSYGLGATKAETVRQVVLPSALPGIVSAVLLGISRAVGETMIVVMAAGQGANLTLNPLEAVTTVTVQIVMLITGDTEADVAAGPAFTLGFTLFCITLLLNVVALRIVRKYRELYD